MVGRAERGSKMESRVLSCSAVTEKTSDFIDGNVGVLSRFQMKLHLLTCKHCRRFVRQMRGTIAVLRQSGDKPPVAAVDAGLLSAFRARAVGGASEGVRSR